MLAPNTLEIWIYGLSYSMNENETILFHMYLSFIQLNLTKETYDFVFFFIFFISFLKEKQYALSLSFPFAQSIALKLCEGIIIFDNNPITKPKSQECLWRNKNPSSV